MALAWSLLSTYKRLLEVAYKAVVAQVSNPTLHFSCSLCAFSNKENYTNKYKKATKTCKTK